MRFQYPLDAAEPGEIGIALFAYDASDTPTDWEQREHQRVLPRVAGGGLPPEVWLVPGTARVLTEEPRDAADRVRIHLVTARRYRDGRLCVWGPGGAGEFAAAGADDDGPYYDVGLAGERRRLFAFRFASADGRLEPAYANRLWAAADGAEVWTHSEAAALARARPVKSRLVLRYRQQIAAEHVPHLHIWQEASDFAADIDGAHDAGGWTTFSTLLYTHLPYGMKVWNGARREDGWWEHDDARRQIIIDGDAERWTLEGSARLFAAEPALDRPVRLQVGAVPPGSGHAAPWSAEVAVDRARAPLHRRVDAGPDGALRFSTYAGLTTSVRLTSARGRERFDRRLDLPDGAAGEYTGWVVAGRSAILPDAPPADLFTDPPFAVERPGAYERDGFVRFALHAPTAARVRLIGEWTDWAARPVELRSTRDGAYWWAQVPVGDLPAEYHGARYKFVLDGREVGDPAAGWVDSSAPDAASRLVRSARFAWGDDGWRIPSRDHLIVFQLHPRRVSGRFGDLPPLERVAREVSDRGGYLRDLGVTALLLMPVNEFAGDRSWGYDPARFYAVESSYGGPDALKRLVDTCHRHGLAVLLDVVFNHAGTTDNVLWSVARESYFAGDTTWGAMIHFAHPQCRHFFAQNLVYLQREFHVDGFRLDHTHTIVHSHERGWYVTEPGPGGGWEFLHALRAAVHGQADPACLLMAEHLPNEWGLTGSGGPMDTQWCDDFHDRLEDACRGEQVMPALARALLTTHRECDDWFEATNYPESHDEVGNEDDRIANVAGWGRGLRMSKVAAGVTMAARGIPMFFMGLEAGEHRQFKMGEDGALDLDEYLRDEARGRVRAWWRVLCELRGDDNLSGPAPLAVPLAEYQLLAVARGEAADIVVVLNFGGWSGTLRLDQVGAGDGDYREWLNSTWPAFAVENEDEHTNGGREARLRRGDPLRVPDYGVVVLQRV
jgi:1,4-alpha-glucan branching enzyme